MLHAISQDELELFARAFAQPGNTHGALAWYWAFPAGHRPALRWNKEPLTIPVLALGHEFVTMKVNLLSETGVDTRAVRQIAHFHTVKLLGGYLRFHHLDCRTIKD